MVTNLIISNGKWKERWLLPAFREEHDRLFAQAQKKDDGERVIIIKGEDGMWWNDDLYFVLERLADDVRFRHVTITSLKRACAKIERKEWKPMEKISITMKGIRISITADETPMNNGVYFLM